MPSPSWLRLSRCSWVARPIRYLGSHPIELGLAPYGLALILGVAALLIGAQVAQRTPQRVALILGCTFALFYSVLWIDLFPRYDHHFEKPLREAAQIAARHSEEGEPTVLIGLRHKPSVIFYGGNATRYVSRKQPTAIAALFQSTTPQVAISTEHFLKNYIELQSHHGELTIIARSNGYVVLSCRSLQ